MPDHWLELARGNIVTLAMLWWVASNAISALPTPKQEERFYGWAYNFLHIVAGNLPRIIPGLRTAQDKMSAQCSMLQASHSSLQTTFDQIKQTLELIQALQEKRDG